MIDKIYFFAINGNEFSIRVYESNRLIVDTRDSYSKLDGYRSCLMDLGYAYGGDFFSELEYREKNSI